ncbi:MAG: CDP-glycerol glycerophosphotransferase family protein [Eubacteriales bacterium]|nr:CDP-glycerol glycerophosphotransferase family protein [Eubacteriales bacterium]
MKLLKKYLKKIRTCILMSWYVLFYYQFGLKELWILIDSKNGKDLGSNLLRIAEELTNNSEYRKYHIFMSCNKDKKAMMKNMIDQYHLKGVTLIRENGFRYTRIAALAKYLFTDTSFPVWFTKKEGQIITNTWHGTPLKKMGKDVKNRSYDMGNVQKNHLIADYLLYPSDYMKDIMISAYFLENSYQGKVLCSGYPRNAVFFDKERSKRLRTELGLDGKRLYGYMPTWRGVLKQIDSQKITNQLEYYLVYLDQKLTDDEIFFVRLHPFISNTIDYSRYRHIKPFPDKYEPYDILNICDCMVTDYSSVLFDYANSRNKIILFVYDRELYMDERGVYVSIDSFPFPQVRTAQELLDEMRRPKDYDDTEFCEKFCTYDESDTAEKLCRHIIKGEKIYEEYSAGGNGKENVVIYSGSLAKSGLTTALLNLLANADMDKRNYYITFRSASLRKFPERVMMLPDNVSFLPIPSMEYQSLGEKLAISRYYRKNKISRWSQKKIDRFFSRLYRRNFGQCNAKYAIHYAGYEKNVINMFLQADVKNMIFVHNDMVNEIKQKGNQHEPTLRRAYHDYYRVAPVTADIYPSTLELGQNKDNIQIVNNCHDYQAVLKKAEQGIEFQKDTMCSVSLERLEEILNGKSRKIINIGRFSPEKGHEMLIQAFDQYHKEKEDSYLIIIGGYGDLYSRTVDLAAGMASGKNIVIIKSIANPMPILKKCDLFVLSSLYEGLGLVLLEADTLGVPVISTDIVGPRGFMKEHGGYLVPLSVDGICQGLEAFDQGRIKAMNVDYEKFNQESVRQFEKLFEG